MSASLAAPGGPTNTAARDAAMAAARWTDEHDRRLRAVETAVVRTEQWISGHERLCAERAERQRAELREVGDDVKRILARSEARPLPDEEPIAAPAAKQAAGTAGVVAVVMALIEVAKLWLLR